MNNEIPAASTTFPIASLTAESIAKRWLTESARTAAEKDHAAHMDLISRQVKLYGVADFDVIEYDQWSAQCASDFAAGMITAVGYQGLKMLASNDNKVMFKTIETLDTRDGQTIENGIEVVLEKESDGKWRLIQERILTVEEVKHDGLREVP